MKLLLLTQKIDKGDDILGFFHRWVEVLAQHAHSIIVVCLEEGEHSLPENVSVYSLGKEKQVSRLMYVRNFYKYIRKHSDSYDTVFIHMNPIYGVLGGLYWKLTNKFVMMWYTHRKVDLKLRIATFFSSMVFTASDYSFRINTNKKKVVGHGIDTKKFICSKEKEDETLRIVSIGRITRIKNCMDLVDLAGALKESAQQPFELQFVGGTSSKDDELYYRELTKRISSLDLNENVTFVGSVPNKDILPYYCNATILINASPDGGVDKVVLEAMSARIPVLVRNEAFRKYFGEYGEALMYTGRNAEEFAQKVLAIVSRPDKEEMLQTLRQKMYDEFDVEGLVKRIMEHYEAGR